MEIPSFLKIGLFQLFFLSGTSAFSQEAYVDPNAPKIRFAYFELAGSGGLGSFNYETKIKEHRLFDLHFRVGLSYAPLDKNNGDAFIFPVMLHFIHGKSKHKLDVGIGQALTITTRASFFIMMPASFGYRLEPEGKNRFWRFSYTPIISYLVDFQWQHWGGISLGFKF